MTIITTVTMITIVLMVKMLTMVKKIPLHKNFKSKTIDIIKMNTEVLMVLVHQTSVAQVLQENLVHSRNLKKLIDLPSIMNLNTMILFLQRLNK